MSKIERDIESIYPLSPMQEGMLFHTLYAPESDVYFEQLSCTIRGTLNTGALVRAWQRVIERHPVLRTLFIWKRREKPLQIVMRQAMLTWDEQDWRSVPTSEQEERLEAYLKADRRRGFDLSIASFMRCGVIRMADEIYRFIWSYHHVLLDGWSAALLLKEVVAFYEAFSERRDVHFERSRPYRDYIVWLQRQEASKAESFWRRELEGFTSPTSFGIDHAPRTSSDDRADQGEQRTKLSVAFTAALRSFARGHQLTLNTLLQSAWALLLSRYSGDEDIVFGTTVSGRPEELAGVESMVGLFINTLPFRVLVSPDAFLLPWLKELQTRQAEMRQYQYSSLVEIQGWSEVPRGQSLFESILVFENHGAGDFLGEHGTKSLEISQFRSFERTNYPFHLVVTPGKELSLRMTYDRLRLDSVKVERLLGHLQTLLEVMSANPERRLSDLSLLTEAERYQLLIEWNKTNANYPETKRIHQLFEEQVDRTPEAVALTFEEVELTYKELNRRANQLAHYLHSLGVSSEVRIGLCVERSLEMVIAVLGVLKAGGAYVPLDPQYPPERLAFMLEDSQAEILLTQERLKHILRAHAVNVVCVDTDWETIAGYSEQNPETQTTPDSLTYVTYTSGSTGKPKGIAMIQRPLVNLLEWQRLHTDPREAERTLQFASLSFDVSFQDMFSTWISGGTVVMISDDARRDIAGLAKLIAENAITRLFIPAVALQVLAEGFSSQAHWSAPLRRVIAGSEQLQITRAITKMFEGLKDCSLHNEYGPSETHVVTALALGASPSSWPERPPVGRPIANTRIYLLDRFMQPVPLGVAGELYIGGVCLARGYLNRPDLTAERFIPDPFGELPGARLYKTGDLARYLPDGNIEFLGRIDHQVKVRGYRIELGEVEAVLAEHTAVREAVVLAREHTQGDKRLVAYLVIHGEHSLNIGDLRNFIKERLPDYMVPSGFVLLDELPLTPNGKVDRKALPPPDVARSDPNETYVAPRSVTEEVLCEIWARVLGCERLGIQDNFFDLGGHSLLATQVISRVREALQQEVPLRYLFEAPTVASLVEKMIQEEQQAGSLERTARLFKELDQMSEAEAKERLDQELAEVRRGVNN
jgi:amino acid adenylation domain-containing protein